MNGPKVVLIGAGSAFFGRQTAWSMVCKDALSTGVLGLVDTNPRRLGWIAEVARRGAEHRGVPLRVEASTDREEILPGADFVILAFAVEGVRLRGVDAQISGKHGMTLCSADTIGPGGILRTVREVPRQAQILEDVERLCPDAWVVNWVNPTTAMGIAMMRHHPRLRSFAICDGPHNPGFDRRLVVRAGLADDPADVDDALLSRVRIRAGGVNHFNWLIGLEKDGEDLTGRVRERLADEAHRAVVRPGPEGEVPLTTKIEAQIADAVGYVPLCTWHTREYLPFFQGRDCAKRGALAIRPWDIEVRKRWMKECHDDMRRIASGKRPIGDFLEKTTADHASDIIEAMWTGSSKRPFYVNTPNRGAVTNMPDDAFLELPSVLDMNEVRPLPFGPIPAPLAGWMRHVLDEHELAVEAGVSCDRAILRRAFLASMLAVSVPDVDACIREMLRRERRYLPEEWFTTDGS